MADVTELQASKLKLLTLAEDYEALAKAAGPSAADGITVRAGKRIAGESMAAA
jgi:hypothetical protein